MENTSRFVIEMKNSMLADLIKEKIRHIEPNTTPIVTEFGSYDPVNGRGDSETSVVILENQEMHKPLNIIRKELLDVIRRELPNIIVLNMDPRTFSEEESLRAMTFPINVEAIPLGDDVIRVGAITS